AGLPLQGRVGGEGRLDAGVPRRVLGRGAAFPERTCDDVVRDVRRVGGRVVVVGGTEEGAERPRLGEEGRPLGVHLHVALDLLLLLGREVVVEQQLLLDVVHAEGRQVLRAYRHGSGGIHNLPRAIFTVSHVGGHFEVGRG